MFHEQGPSFFELAEQALSSTTRGYDLLAPKFEYTPFRTPDVLLEPLGVAAAEEGPVESALDLCCGTGAVVRHLRPHCTDYVTGLDRSEGMLAEASRRIPEAPGGAEIRLVQGDVFEMPFGAEFDLAACCGAFGHILQERQDAFVRGIRRVLRPGGRFLFVTRPMPSVWSPSRLFSHAFNAAMHVRNAFLEPPFIMYYMTFPLGRARRVLERQGFELDVRAPWETGRFEPYRLVVARRSSG